MTVWVDGRFETTETGNGSDSALQLTDDLLCSLPSALPSAPSVAEAEWFGVAGDVAGEVPRGVPIVASISSGGSQGPSAAGNVQLLLSSVISVMRVIDWPVVVTSLALPSSSGFSKLNGSFGTGHSLATCTYGNPLF